MPLIRCQHCGRNTFTFASRAYVATCASCGARLATAREASTVEAEIRQRLYGERTGWAGPRRSSR